MILRTLGACLTTLAWAPAAAGTLTASPADLAGRLAAAGPGDVVELAAGAYPAIVIRRQVAAPGVTVKPAPGAAVRAASLSISGSAGWTFQGFEVGVDPRTKNAAYVTGSERIVLDGLVIVGPGGADGGDAQGVFVRDCRDTVVRGVDVSELSRGISHLDCVGLTIDGNTVRRLRGHVDGIRGSSSQIAITNNAIGPLYATDGWHADAVQMWTLAGKPLSDILIAGNVFERGDGDAPQCIFIGDEGGVGYERITVRDNVCVSTIANGIMVAGAVDPLIEGNLLIGWADVRDARGRTITPWIMVRGSVSGRVIGNTAPAFNNYQSTGIVSERNAVIPLAARGDVAQVSAWRAAQAPSADPRDVRIAELLTALAAAEARAAALDADLDAARSDGAAAVADLNQALDFARADAARLRSVLASIGKVSSAALER